MAAYQIYRAPLRKVDYMAKNWEKRYLGHQN